MNNTAKNGEKTRSKWGLTGTVLLVYVVLVPLISIFVAWDLHATIHSMDEFVITMMHLIGEDITYIGLLKFSFLTVLKYLSPAFAVSLVAAVFLDRVDQKPQ